MKSKGQNILLLILHIGIGAAALYFSTIVWIVGLFPLIGGTYAIIRNKNVNNEAVMWAAYYVGAEVLLRMTGANIVYEIGKYAVMWLLLIGLLVERRPYTFGLSLVYILLLLPSIFLIDFGAVDNVRTHILFNLSGPMCLFVSVWYFNKRILSQEQIEKVMLNILLPIIAMTVLITLKTPDFSAIKFKAGSNFTTSGGFGPNQVATQLGLGILILGYAMLQKIKLFRYRSIDIVLLLFVIFRGALTLSRGGIVGAGICLLFCAAFALSNKRWKFTDFLKLGAVVVIIALIANFSWKYLDRVTNGQLYNRYTGRSTTGEYKKDPTSGREIIFESELEAFANNPMTGIGLGMGKLYRQEKLDLLIATHNEFGRMLGEHGMLGAIDIVILIAILTRAFIKKWKYNRTAVAWMVSCAAFALITMGHSALRIALPSYLFGISLAYIIPALKTATPSPKKVGVYHEDTSSNGYIRPGWSGARSS